MATATYSIDQVAFSWKDLDFAKGLAQGTSITETHNAAGATVTASADGQTAYSTFDPNMTGQLTFLVDQGSLLHQQLLAVWNAMVDPDTRKAQYGTGSMRDASNNLVVTYPGMHIAKEPEESRGVESAVFSWVFNFERRRKAPDTSQSNIVG
jgi:hypothetical protein